VEDVTLNYVQTMDDLTSYREWLHSDPHRVLAVDTETTGLNPRHDRIRLAQVGDAHTGWAIPWDRWAGAVVELVVDRPNPLVFHNAKFDVRFIEAGAGITVPWHRVRDTRAMAHVVDSTRATGLKSLAARLVDRRAAAMQSSLDEAMTTAGWTWATVPMDFPAYWQYAALDVVLTARLAEVLEQELDTHGARAAYDVEVAALHVLKCMETRGAPVDVDFAVDANGRMLRYCDEVAQWCGATHGVSPGSTAKVAKRLVELGAHLDDLTPSGNLKLDKDVLLKQVAEAPPDAAALARTVLSHRQHRKLSSTYLRHFIDENVGGRVYCSINPLGAKTGRMSVADPALQTLPRASADNPAAITVRDCFVPSPGNKLVMIDYDQIELRLAAHFSQDATMLSVLSDLGLDPFTEFARRIYRDDTVMKSDPRRQLTKNASYAKLYGAGAAKFALTAGVPFAQGKHFLALFDSTFPGVLALQRRVEEVSKHRLRDEGTAYVRTPLGRRLVAEDDATYKLVNYLIQGTAADVLKMKLIELDHAGLADHALLPVHDEVIFDVPEEDAAEFAREAAHVMSVRGQYTVDLPAGADGPHDRWGDKYR